MRAPNMLALAFAALTTAIAISARYWGHAMAHRPEGTR